MGAVGATSAYATDIVAVQRVYYNQVYNFSCEFRRIATLDMALDGVNRSMDARYVHPVDRLCNWWCLTPLLGSTPFDE